MVDIKKDSREWLVEVRMRSNRCPLRYYPANYINRCPLRYYPANYIGCTIQTGKENDCNMDRCPIKVVDEKGAFSLERSLDHLRRDGALRY